MIHTCYVTGMYYITGTLYMWPLHIRFVSVSIMFATISKNTNITKK